MPLTAIALNCSLKKSSGEASSTDAMIAVLKEHLAEQDVELAETIRIADYNVPPGVTSDEGEGDDWPGIRAKILSHDILVFGGPIWMGQIGSVAKRVLERMDAFTSETDVQGRMPSFGKVAIADDRGGRGLLLGRRGDGQHRLQGVGRNPRCGDRDRTDVRDQCRASRQTSRRRHLPRDEVLTARNAHIP